jgi:hypothetical protein
MIKGKMLGLLIQSMMGFLQQKIIEYKKSLKIPKG